MRKLDYRLYLTVFNQIAAVIFLPGRNKVLCFPEHYFDDKPI
jgi:hypothetical protein